MHGDPEWRGVSFSLISLGHRQSHEDGVPNSRVRSKNTGRALVQRGAVIHGAEGDRSANEKLMEWLLLSQEGNRYPTQCLFQQVLQGSAAWRSNVDAVHDGIQVDPGPLRFHFFCRLKH